MGQRRWGWRWDREKEYVVKWEVEVEGGYVKEAEGD